MYRIVHSLNTLFALAAQIQLFGCSTKSWELSSRKKKGKTQVLAWLLVATIANPIISNTSWKSWLSSTYLVFPPSHWKINTLLWNRILDLHHLAWQTLRRPPNLCNERMKKTFWMSYQVLSTAFHWTILFLYSQHR